MNYLFIVTESESANGICAETVMRQLAKTNHVFCITNREYGFPKQFVKDGIQYQTVSPRVVYRISSFVARSNGKLLYRKVIKNIGVVINKIKLALTMYMWPLISPAYAQRIFRVADKICVTHKIDCIVPVYTQIDTLVAAHKIKIHHRKIQYVPYFLDALSGGYGPRWFTKKQVIARGLYWEHRLLPSADWIIAMESSRKHHQLYSANSPYYRRIVYFDLPLFQPTVRQSISQLKIMDPHRCNFLYVGTLPSGIRSPEYILNVFKKMDGDWWDVYFIGTLDCAVLNATAKNDMRIHVLGHCSHEIALQYQKEADILINIGNNNPYMTPSKIFEYMSFGKPLVSTAAIDAEASKTYLNKYPAALILDESIELFDAAEQLREFAEKYRGCELDVSYLREIYYRNTPDALAEFLQSIGKEYK